MGRPQAVKPACSPQQSPFMPLRSGNPRVGLPLLSKISHRDHRPISGSTLRNWELGPWKLNTTRTYSMDTGSSFRELFESDNQYYVDALLGA